ncbi:hypothetical protein SSX86_026013 [Deinandra increscens subsp. villosa]|uniref:Uncharacterized protein n=1 Tax=Deinandra increscens subsp. villosa TaxID=3103831 RepID=A0AAP0CDQ5_9ASTR
MEVITNQTPLLLGSLDADVIDDYFRAVDDGEDQLITAGEEQTVNLVHSRRNPNRLTGEKTNLCIAYVATLWSIDRLEQPFHVAYLYYLTFYAYVMTFTTVCLTVAFGFYPNGIIEIGMGSSLLLQPNRFFVKTVTVEQPSRNNVGPILYGFNNQPPLDDISSWSEHWVYFLNEGSQINISYSAQSSRLLLTISRGSDGYGHDFGNGYCYASGRCLYDESDPSTIFSWNIIQGDGLIQQNILVSGNYYITVENLNLEVEEVELNISGKALIYDTDNAFYMCMLARGRCVFHVFPLEVSHLVLTTPALNQETSSGEWRVQLMYGPRWITLFGGIVVINGMMFIGIQLLKSYGFI